MSTAKNTPKRQAMAWWTPRRRVLGMFTLVVAVVIWIDLAVGLFGLPWSGS